MKKLFFIMSVMVLFLLAGCGTGNPNSSAPSKMCNNCRGTGEFICAMCNGQGSGYDQNGVHQTCPVCNGTGNVPCPICEGRGMI